jgi:hypothetical protein
MIRRKDCNILLFVKRILEQDPAVLRLSKVTGLDKVEMGSPLIQSRLLIQPKRPASEEGVKSIEEELKNAEEVVKSVPAEGEAVVIEEGKVAEAEPEV